MIKVVIPDYLKNAYSDVLTAEVSDVLNRMIPFNQEIHRLMEIRYERRRSRFLKKERIGFLPADDVIPFVNLKVSEIREGKFTGAPIPADLQRQWIQGTGPAARPGGHQESNLRNVAYALLSGADGWMFDCEDALGQVSTMSLDHQRSLKMAIHRDPLFLKVAEEVADTINSWSQSFLGRKVVTDFLEKLNFTTIICRSRGFHLDDRHLTLSDGTALAASLADTIGYIVNNYRRLQLEGRSLVLYLPKIQTAAEAGLWHEILDQLEYHLQLESGTIKTYVLVEQLEATYQLLEIRAALGKHFVGFNTGRWDYINSVSDAMAWDSNFINPDIEEITMTYGYMRHYEDRVRQVVNIPDSEGRYVLWQGGMEPNIPVGSEAGVKAGMERALRGARREQQAGASGKWVAHWKMVHLVRPVWEEKGELNQMGRPFPRPDYDTVAADKLLLLEPAARTIRGARNLLSVVLQYANAFAQGLQAAALKPADFFGNEDVLYLMEDMATGEIRASILWEWVHKNAPLTLGDEALNLQAGDRFDASLFKRLLEEEYRKLVLADHRDVHETSKKTTLPISRILVEKYVLSEIKFPWFIDLLNINLNVMDQKTAEARMELFIDHFIKTGNRITHNPDAIA